MSLWACDKCGALTSFNFGVCSQCGGQAHLYNPQLPIGQSVVMTMTTPWQPIDTCPHDAKLLFWVVPKTADETYCDTSGNPIVSRSKPHVELTFRGCWSSLCKATHWMPLPDAPR